MLGFLYNWRLECVPEEGGKGPHFVATTKFGARIPEDDTNWEDDDLNWEDYTVWDCRHGRVLLFYEHWSPGKLVVWDPMTGCRKWGAAPDVFSNIWAAVLCDVSGCDHRACHEGPFRVVFVGLDKLEGVFLAYESVSSPETEEIHWSETCLDLIGNYAEIQPLPPVLIDDALHFMLVYDDDHLEILKYDLVSKDFSVIDVPLEETDAARDAVLIAMEDGSLGFAHVDGSTFNLWSWQMGSDGVEAWTGRIVINLKELLSIRNPEKRLRLIGSVEVCDTVFVTTDLGIYEINLKSLHQKKIWKREKYRALFPYMGFYNLRGARLAGAMA